MASKPVKSHTKEIIIIAIFIAVIAGLFLATMNNTTQSNQADNLQYVLGGCEEVRYDIPDALELNPVANSLEFMQTFNNYCNTDYDNLKITYRRDGTNIYVDEIFDADVVTLCTCPFTVTGTIGNLSSGTYILRISHENKYTNEEKQVLFTKSFEIR